MAFTDQMTLAQDTVFKSRVQHAIVKTAIAIANEDTATPRHEARRTLAREVVHAPEAYATRFAYGVVTLETMSDQSSDNDIETTVASIWNAYS